MQYASEPAPEEMDVLGIINDRGVDLYGDRSVMAILADYFYQIPRKDTRRCANKNIQNQRGAKISEVFGNFMKGQNDIFELLLIDNSNYEIIVVSKKEGGVLTEEMTDEEFSRQFTEYAQLIEQKLNYHPQILSEIYA